MALAEIIEVAPARRASGSIVVGGIDLLANLQSEAVLSFQYEDHTDDKLDDLSVEIADPDRTWMKSFLPQKGVEITATIKVFDWGFPGDSRTVECGSMTLDQIELKGPPTVVSLRASPVNMGSGLKNEKHFKGWENVPLSNVLSELAVQNGIFLTWDVPADPFLPRVDQIEMPDLEFARDLSKDNGLSVKLFNRQLIVYSEKFYESRPPVYTIKYGASQIISYSFTSKLNDLVGEASLEYTDPPTGKLISATFTPSPAPIGVTAKLKLNLGVQGAEGGGGGGAPAAREGGGPISFLSADADVAQAKAKVEAHARAKNKKEFSCTMQLFGSPDYLSGLNVELVDWGIFDGTWFIEVATHTINASGYVTELQMRKVLGW